MSEGTVVGLKPCLPPPLSRSPWWTEPVRAERLAALRVGVGLTLLLDVLGTYLPRARDFYGPDSLTAPGTFVWDTSPLEWHRVLLDRVSTFETWYVLLWVWAAAGALLALGVLPRAAAAVAWFFSVSVTRISPAMHNSGDQVRNILLLYLILTPCGAVWSLQSWRRRRDGPVFVHPWALRLLLIQLAITYLINGLFKMRGAHWHSGRALSLVLGDSAWTRWSFAGWPLPAWLLQAMTWGVVLWELTFPFCLFVPRLRAPALWMGVAFHVGTGVTMRLGPFPLYMLCLYLPLIPWEQFRVAERGLRRP
jgi:uncharacterized membrane protein YphA (DoxX/SURF4 family)